jgi:hypothetical protein
MDGRYPDVGGYCGSLLAKGDWMRTIWRCDSRVATDGLGATGRVRQVIEADPGGADWRRR